MELVRPENSRQLGCLGRPSESVDANSVNATLARVHSLASVHFDRSLLLLTRTSSTITNANELVVVGRVEPQQSIMEPGPSKGHGAKMVN